MPFDSGSHFRHRCLISDSYPPSPLFILSRRSCHWSFDSHKTHPTWMAKFRIATFSSGGRLAAACGHKSEILKLHGWRTLRYRKGPILELKTSASRFRTSSFIETGRIPVSEVPDFRSSQTRATDHDMPCLRTTPPLLHPVRTTKKTSQAPNDYAGVLKALAQYLDALHLRSPDTMRRVL